jgi:hypothetical protein
LAALALLALPASGLASAPSGATKTPEPIVASPSVQVSTAKADQKFCIPSGTAVFWPGTYSYTGKRFHTQKFTTVIGTLIPKARGGGFGIVLRNVFPRKVVLQKAPVGWATSPITKGACKSTPPSSSGAPVPGDTGGDVIATDGNADGDVQAQTADGTVSLGIDCRDDQNSGAPPILSGNLTLSTALPVTAKVSLLVPGNRWSMLAGTDAEGNASITSPSVSLQPVTYNGSATAYVEASVTLQSGRLVRLKVQVRPVCDGDSSGVPPDNGTGGVDPSFQSNEYNLNQVILVRVNAGTLTVAKAKTAIKKAVRRRYSGARGLDVRQCTVRSATAVYCAWVGFTIPKADGTDVYTGTALATLRSNGIRVWFPAFKVRHTPLR